MVSSDYSRVSPHEKWFHTEQIWNLVIHNWLPHLCQYLKIMHKHKSPMRWGGQLTIPALHRRRKGTSQNLGVCPETWLHMVSQLSLPPLWAGGDELCHKHSQKWPEPIQGLRSILSSTSNIFFSFKSSTHFLSPSSYPQNLYDKTSSVFIYSMPQRLRAVLQIGKKSVCLHIICMGCMSPTPASSYHPPKELPAPSIPHCCPIQQKGKMCLCQTVTGLLYTHFTCEKKMETPKHC